MEKPVMFTIAIGYSESFEILEYMSLNDAGGRAAQLKIDLTKVLAPYTINVTWREEIDYRLQGAVLALRLHGWLITIRASISSCTPTRTTPWTQWTSW